MITIGADPEVFVRNKNTHNMVSGHDLIQGTKENPYKVKLGAVQVDGLALEFNIDPASSALEFTRNTGSVLRTLNKMVQKKNSGLTLAIQPTAHFQQDYFDVLPTESKRLGCDPDFNAYTEAVNDPPTTDRPFRTGAGHIHIGWTEGATPSEPGHFYDCISVTKQLDCSIGFLSNLWDKDTERMSLYGKMGTFRPKTYGVEYRVLSNAWLRFPKLYSWIFDTAMKSMEDLGNGIRYYDDPDLPFDQIDFPNTFPNRSGRTDVMKAYNTIRYNLNVKHKHHFSLKILEKEVQL